MSRVYKKSISTSLMERSSIRGHLKKLTKEENAPFVEWQRGIGYGTLILFIQMLSVKISKNPS